MTLFTVCGRICPSVRLALTLSFVVATVGVASSVHAQEVSSSRLTRVQVLDAPPNHGRMRFPTMGCTRKIRNAEEKMAATNRYTPKPLPARDREISGISRSVSQSHLLRVNCYGYEFPRRACAGT